MLRRLYKLWPLAILVLVLSGCSTTVKGPDGKMIPKPINADNGFWDKFVVGPLSHFLDFIAHIFGGEYGLAILVVTIIIRLIILPLTLKQVRSSKAMQALQPELAKLKEKYKDDPKLQQEETMKLFSQNNVNPMAGCLPIFIQMPVLMGLYHAIMRNGEIHNHTFLWLQLGTKDPWVLPIIAALTTWLQQKMMSKTTGNQMGQMQVIMYIFPIMIFFMSKNFPAALPLYWIFSNIFTIVQNYFIYGRSSKTTPALATAGVTDTGKKSGKSQNAKPKNVQPGKIVNSNTKKAKKPSK
ncbi:membrane protein insertase YidC [Gorillibacterium massiliense]|uniref:membrane protein insertase YidC n=1 Tax=Gorillibacterium massiliense TaxID=1280390 RepID=UPI001EE1CDE1|nr:membrane protein insertase YidC [Gorillibacterium massiliense]